MAQTSLTERLVPWSDLVSSAPAPGYSLNVVFIYQDAQTRKWTKELYERVTTLAGPHTARATWWRISDLREPGVLAGAVSTAMRADVLVVAVRPDSGLSLPFYVWVNAWLPHRQPKTGALVALLDTADQNTHNIARLRGYLECVARQGMMDFLVEQRTLPAEPGEPDCDNNGTLAVPSLDPASYKGRRTTTMRVPNRRRGRNLGEKRLRY